MQIGVFRIMLQLREKPWIWEEFMSMQLGYNINSAKKLEVKINSNGSLGIALRTKFWSLCYFSRRYTTRCSM